MTNYIRKSTVFFLFYLLSYTAKSQINFYGNFSPRYDSSEMNLSRLIRQKNLDSAINLINQAIQSQPDKGVNYFNKAVINYYKKIIAKSFSLLVDTLIYNDCQRALDYGYKKPEVYYLIFSQISQTDRVLGSGLPSYVYKKGVSKELNYREIKEYIDSAIDLSNYEHVRYIFARMIFFYKKLGEEQSEEQIQFSYGNKYEIDFSDDNRFKLDCMMMLEKSKDNYKRAASYYFLSQISLIKDKDTIGAIQNLSDAIAADTTDYVYYSERATLKYKMGNYKGAIWDLDRYLVKERRPEDFITRANCYSLVENEKKAIVDYSTAIDLFETQLKERKKKNEFLKINYIKMHLGQGYYLRGNSFLLLNNRVKACMDFNQAVNLGYKMAQGAISESCN